MNGRNAWSYPTAQAGLGRSLAHDRAGSSRACGSAPTVVDEEAPSRLRASTQSPSQYNKLSTLRTFGYDPLQPCNLAGTFGHDPLP